MIPNLSNKFAGWLIRNGAIEEDRELYVYGAECLLNELTGNIMLLLFAYFFRCIPEIIVWNLFFLPFRTQLGGYHCTTHLRCLIFSTALGIGSVFAATALLPFTFLIPGSILLSIITALAIAPVCHPNRPVSIAYQQITRRRALYIILLESTLILASSLFSLWIPMVASFGILSASILGILGWHFNKKRQTHTL